MSFMYIITKDSPWEQFLHILSKIVNVHHYRVRKEVSLLPPEIMYLVAVLITDSRNQTYVTGVSSSGVVFVWNFVTTGQLLQTLTWLEFSMNNVVLSGQIIVYRWETQLSDDPTQTLLSVHLILGGLKSCPALASSARRLPGGERSCSQNRSMYCLLLLGTQNQVPTSRQQAITMATRSQVRNV